MTWLAPMRASSYGLDLTRRFVFSNVEPISASRTCGTAAAANERIFRTANVATYSAFLTTNVFTFRFSSFEFSPV